MKQYKLFKLLSNISFGIGAAMSALALYLMISTRASLPPGMCPVDNYQALAIAALVVLAASFALSIIADRKKKAMDNDRTS